MKIVLLILSVFISQIVLSQEKEATLIFHDSTTVEGLGEIRKNIIIFRAGKNAKKLDWSYDLVKGIQFTEDGYDETFQYVQIDKYSKPVLLEVIDEGKVTLYKGYYTQHNNITGGSPTALLGNVQLLNSDQSTKYYLKRPYEEYASDFSNKSFEKSYSKYFSDCEALVTRIQKHKYTKEDVIDLVEFYNNYCEAEE